jgi:hypothetical protein
MNQQSRNEIDDLDPATTVRLPVRNTVLAQIEAALLAETLSVSEAQTGFRGIDPYNQAPPRKDTWAHKR